MASVDAPRTRRSFARLEKVLDVPNLIDIQKKSFSWLVDPEGGGLRETIDDISPIEDYTGNLAVQFGEFHFDPPVASLEECREKDLTYARPLTVTVGFINRETGEIREQSVFMGDFPWMTDRGTFVINGTERVVVTQLVRSPGRLPDGAQGRREAGLRRQPDAGPRLVARAGDRQEGPRLRPHRPQAQAAGHRPAARDGLLDRRGDPQAVRGLGLHPQHDRGRHRRHEERRGRPDRAVQEAAPGRAAERRERQVAAAPALLRPQALRPHARRPLQAQLAPEPRHRPRHAGPDPRRHHRPGQGARHAPARARHERGARRVHRLRRGGAQPPARGRRRPPRRVRALRQPPSAHGRRADPGGLPDRPLPHGARRPRAPHHRGRGHDHAADDHQHPARSSRP